MSINLRALKDVDYELEFVCQEIATLDAEIKTLRSTIRLIKDGFPAWDRMDTAIVIIDMINGKIEDALDLGEILNDRRWELVQERLAILGAAFAKGAIE